MNTRGVCYTLAVVMPLAFLALPTTTWAEPYLASPAFPGKPFAVCQNSDQIFAQKAEALIAAGIDAERAKLAPHAPVLHGDPVLTRIARKRSCDMARGAAFSHTDAEGRFIAGDMVRAELEHFGATGENIMQATIGSRAIGPEEFSRLAIETWMKSPGHRANIVNPHYDLSGVGVAMVGDHVFATQIFHGAFWLRTHR